MTESYDAVVVGSGPNGLTAAVLLAKAGKSVLVVEAAATPGGGARTAELTLPGFHHDVCSAAHPLAVASPVFASLDLAQVGVKFIHPPLPFAHPLDGGRAAALSRSLDQTAASLGADGPAWRRHLGPFVERFDELKHTLLSPVLRVPGSPVLMARFGLQALQSAVSFCEESFETDEARALFAGCAAHSFAALEAPLTASFGFALAVTGHAVGWPILEGGSATLVRGLVALLERHGGVLRCGQPVRTLAQLPPAKAIFFDTTPAQLAAIAGDALPPRFHRAAAAFRRGMGVFKLDYALRGPMPWTAEAPRRAGTVHLGGTLRELAASEAAVARGEAPERPYVLVAQQSLFDSSRAPAGQHTLWAYCHVPNGCTVDMSSRIEAQLERFAPGFKDLVLARVARAPADFEAYNQNYAGGDISGGAVDGLQLFLRPRPAFDPYRTPNPKLFICSSSAPPGPGVHGMCGYWAVQSALRGPLA